MECTTEDFQPMSIYQLTAELLDIVKLWSVVTSCTRPKWQDICFEIVLWTYSPAQAIKSYHKSLCNLLPTEINKNFEIDIPKEITNNIIEYLTNKTALKWSKCDDEDVNKYLEFSNNYSCVRYKGIEIGWRDYVIVKSINFIEFGEKIFINCYVKSLGDEMWIGLMNNDGYKDRKSLRYNKHCITYYYRGCIYEGSDIWYDVARYKSGDWITFEILLNHKIEDCIFNVYKNSEFVKDCTERLQWFIELGVMQQLVFIVEVDSTNDYVFIEKILTWSK